MPDERVVNAEDIRLVTSDGDLARLMYVYTFRRSNSTPLSYTLEVHEDGVAIARDVRGIVVTDMRIFEELAHRRSDHDRIMTIEQSVMAILERRGLPIAFAPHVTRLLGSDLRQLAVALRNCPENRRDQFALAVGAVAVELL